MDFTLTLVRHGESEANVKHMLSGWMDVPLTVNGRRALEELRMSVDYPESEECFSSSLTRCIDTFHILFPSKKPVISDDFKEINFHSLEGHILATRDEMMSYFSSWIKDETYRDEETMTHLMERSRRVILNTIANVEGTGKHSALIVTHSGFMRALIISLFNLERSCFLEMFVPNGLGYVVTFRGLEPVSYRKLERSSLPI